MSLNRIRRIRVEIDNLNSLMTTYINNHYHFNKQKEKQIYTLLQFLSFIRTLTSEKQSLGDINYYQIEFPLRYFLDFIGLKGVYHRQRILQLLNSLYLLNTPIIEIFEDDSFRSYVLLPRIDLDNSKKLSILKIWIQESFYFYRYSFVFPTDFIREHGKNDLKLKLYFIQIMTTSSLKKEFKIQQFLNQFHFSN